MLVAIAFVGMFGFVAPIVQNPAYHAFCDIRTFLIPNAFNVLSNLPFLVALDCFGCRNDRASSTAVWSPPTALHSSAWQ